MSLDESLTKEYAMLEESDDTVSRHTVPPAFLEIKLWMSGR